MNFRQNIAYFIRHLREKHRLSVRNQHTDREIWYMHISPLNLLAGLLALILILFILIASTVAYTPVLDLLPGYPGKKSRTMGSSRTSCVSTRSSRNSATCRYTARISR